MEELTISYTGLSYLILGSDEDSGALLETNSECINYLLSYCNPINLKFDETIGNNKFSEEDKKMFEKVISNHNNLKNLESVLNKSP